MKKDAKEEVEMSIMKNAITFYNLFNRHCDRVVTVGDRQLKLSQIFDAPQNSIREPTPDEKFLKELGSYVMDSRIILHAKSESLLKEFLESKKSSGTMVEKNIYRNMSVEGFVARLIKKKMLSFNGTRGSHRPVDTKYGAKFSLERENLLEDMEKMSRSNAGFLRMEDYLTLDEITVASYVGMSTMSQLINSCSRANTGMRDVNYQGMVAVFIYLSGPRLTVSDRFEAGLLLKVGEKREESEKMVDSLAPHYKKYFGDENFTKIHKVEDEKCTEISIYSDAYIERMRITFEVMLHEANRRGVENGKKVMIRLPGLGLGVNSKMDNGCQLTESLKTFYMEALIAAIGGNCYPRIAVIDIIYLFDTQIYENATDLCGHVIEFLMSKNNLGAIPRQNNMLLAIVVPSEPNAFPGNFYWQTGVGVESNSSDEAAVKCSFVSDLLNPYINQWFLDNINIYPVKNSLVMDDPDAKITVPQITDLEDQNFILSIKKDQIIEPPEIDKIIFKMNRPDSHLLTDEACSNTFIFSLVRLSKLSEDFYTKPPFLTLYNKKRSSAFSSIENERSTRYVLTNLLKNHHLDPYDFSVPQLYENVIVLLDVDPSLCQYFNKIKDVPHHPKMVLSLDCLKQISSPDRFEEINGDIVSLLPAQYFSSMTAEDVKLFNARLIKGLSSEHYKTLFEDEERKDALCFLLADPNYKPYVDGTESIAIVETKCDISLDSSFALRFHSSLFVLLLCILFLN